MRLPNFFIVGAPRAGTTSLYHHLKHTPTVFMPQKKEPHFFSVIHPRLLKPVKDEKEYYELFKNVKNEKAVGEASTSYLNDPESPKLIYQRIPNARIIIILRDPVERAFSHYMLARRGLEKRSFHEAIHAYFNRKNFDLSVSYLEYGFYSEQIKRYLEIFGSEKVKIIIFEEYVKNVREKVLEVLRFLRVNEEPPNLDKVYKPHQLQMRKLSSIILGSKTVRKIGSRFVNQFDESMWRKLFFTEAKMKTKILEKDKMLLKRIYRKDALKTQEILGYSLPWFPLIEKP